MTTTTTTILDALLSAEAGLTLSGLAEVTGLPCAELRAALDGLGATQVSSALIEREAGKPKVRVFAATDAARCAREAVLHILAEQGTEEALRAETRETLRAAALAFEVPGVKVKATKDALVALILAHRATVGVGLLCSRCGEEPVDATGEVCTVCEEAATPAKAERTPRTRKPKVERAPGDLRIRIRRPDVALAFSDAERAAVEAIVKGAPSQRAAQRDAGLWLADRSAERLIDAEVLRTILRTHGVLNVANFTINAKKDGWTRVERDGALVGWTAPKHDIKVTAKAAERGA